VVGTTKRTVSEIIQILHNFAPEWMGSDYNITQKNCVKFCDSFLHSLDPKLQLPKYTVSMTEIGARFSKEKLTPKQRPALSPQYIFGNSTEKRQMWLVAESIMQDYYSELVGNEKDDQNHIPSFFPKVRHAKTSFSMRRDPAKTELRCMQAFHRIQRNKYQYLNSSVRNLCH
jgi:hypothetical protein